MSGTIAVALALLGGISACGGEGLSGDDLLDEGSAEASQAAESCVILKRYNVGTPGVQDANIVSDLTDPTKASTNFGGVQQMITGFVSSGTRQILLQYDLGAIPAGQIITSGSLTFRMIQSPGKANVNIHQIVVPWSEGSVTWTSFAGGYDPLPFTTFGTLGVPNNSNMTVDLTTLVQGWYSGATPNHGVLFDHPLAGHTTVGSSEAPTVGPRPALTVCYVPDPCAGVTCAPIDCMAPGTCEPTSGQCVYQPAADGSACSTGTCQAGVCVSASGPCDPHPQAGLAAWYRFEDTSGPVCDSSGNHNDGTALGSGFTRGVAGAAGTAIRFNGGDGRVRVPASASLDMLTAGTIELWVWLDDLGFSPKSTVSRGTGNNDNNVLMNATCGNMQTIYTWGGITTNVTSACGVLSAQQWIHIAVVNDGVTASFYVNDVLTTTAPGGALGHLTSDLYIGRREQGLFSMAGAIDEIKWWTVVRTRQQICGDAGGTWVNGACSF